MAVEFNASGEGLNFGAISSMESLSTFTVSAWIYLSDYGYSSTYSTIAQYTTNPAAGFFNFSGANGNIGVVVDNVLFFSNGFSTTNGWWYSAADSIALGSWYHALVTFDNTSSSNNPAFYSNGVSKATTEQQSPAGTSLSYSAASMYAGYFLGLDAGSMNGLIQDLRVYNRILSANEIATLANSRRLKTVMNGLVFWAPMWGANSDTFDGLTLGAGHRITDWAGGAQGTPAGSPIGRGNTIQGY